MEFVESNKSEIVVANTKKRNKKKDKNKKRREKKKNKKIGMNQNPTIAEEFSSFIYMLGMDPDDDSDNEEASKTAGSQWTANYEQESAMSETYVASLVARGQDVLEEEFNRQFRTHLLVKRHLMGAVMKRLKDRIFLLMAKEKEVQSENTDDSKSQKILYEHFLYEELRLQHQFVTTPQIADTPNDIAFKIAMVPIICGMIRNCNDSRENICLEIQDDDIESAALLAVPMFPLGSCLRSVLRPLYRELVSRHTSAFSQSCDTSKNECTLATSTDEEAFDELSPKVKSLCCSSDSEMKTLEKNNETSPLFFDGPPEWHTNLALFMKRIQYSKPSAEIFGFIKHSLREAQELRYHLEQKKFYDFAYGNGHSYQLATEIASCDKQSYQSLPLPFNMHVILHRAAHAVVTPKANVTIPSDAELLTLISFKQLVNIRLPPILVTPCNTCQTLCTSECVCGLTYCSSTCLESGLCKGCTDGCVPALKYLTPVAWGRAPIP